MRSPHRRPGRPLGPAPPPPAATADRTWAATAAFVAILAAMSGTVLRLAAVSQTRHALHSHHAGAVASPGPAPPPAALDALAVMAPTSAGDWAALAEVMLATALLVLCWRAYRFTRTHGATLRHRFDWTLLSVLIPVWNLVRPFLGVIDLYRAVHGVAVHGHRDGADQSRTILPVALWGAAILHVGVGGWADLRIMDARITLALGQGPRGLTEHVLRLQADNQAILAATSAACASAAAAVAVMLAAWLCRPVRLAVRRPAGADR